MSVLTESQYISQALAILSKDAEMKKRFAVDVSSLEERLRISQANRYRLAVMGVTSSGKSTLLNALLGKDLLPAVAIPSSSQLVSCIKGKSWEATVYFEDGKKKVFTGRNLTSDVISQYGDEKYNPHNKKKVKQIEVVSPDLLTPNDLILEDSPGLDAYGLEGHEHITMHTLLPSTDFCMFVTTCKTNSDQKMLEVLNEIAGYNKHVIIIQNMIDSLKPSPDGSQSVQDVADDHLRRIQRIVDRSNIKDKNKIHIVQISAMQALAVRKFRAKGNRENEKSRNMWRASNFDEFQKVLSNVFNAVKPKIEQGRLVFLRRELEEINRNNCPQLSDKAPVSQIDYEQVRKDLDKAYREANTQIDKSLDSLEKMAKDYSAKNWCTASDISAVRQKDNTLADEIASALSRFNNAVKVASSKLNVSDRDYAIRVASRKSHHISAATYTETKRVKKSGFWNGVKRFFGSNSGYDYITEEKPDYEKNKENIIEFIYFSHNDLVERTNAWDKNATSVMNKINELIDRKVSQFEESLRAFRSQKLSQEKLLGVKRELQAIISQLPNMDYQIKSDGQTQHAIRHLTLRTEIGRETYNLISVAKSIISNISQYLWANILEDRGCDLISWDMDSARRFMHTSLGIDFSLSSSNTLFRSQKCGFIKVIDMNKESIGSSFSTRKLVIMINATQSGAAKKQLAPLLQQISRSRINPGNVIFVIQDLDEVVNGGDLKGSIQDIRQFLKKNGCDRSLLLPNHRNPLYALAMYERNQRNQLHAEEMDILNNLRTKLNYLFESDSSQIISDLIREN